MRAKGGIMTYAIFATATVVSTLSAGGALAGLDICNDSAQRLSIAVASMKEGEWVASGWWVAEPAECVSPVKGDLRNRYYYYRATTPDGVFIEGDTYFCVSQEVFDAPGQGNCEARGYQERGFAKLDTGTEATHFRLSLHDADRPAPTSSGGPKPAGTYGEPYSDNVNLQGCISEGDARYCEFHASGTKFIVFDDGRTPQYVFSIMETLDPGTPLFVEGDLEAIYDRTADVVLRDVSVRSWERSDSILHSLQGQWYSVDDPNSQFTVLGSERDNTYDGGYMGRDYLSVSAWCGDFEGGGPYLYARDEETGDDYCYSIESIGDFNLTLMYLPNGNFLEYRKLD